MTEKNFGVKKLDIIGSGTPTIESPSGGDLNIIAATSTFSGDVNIDDKLTVDGGTIDNPVDVSTISDFVGRFASTDAVARLIIQDNSSTSNGNGIQVQGDTLKLLTGNGGVALTCDANQDVTVANDLNVTGVSTFSDNVTLPDNKKLRLGNTAGDFDIYYDDNVYLKTGSKGFNIQSYNGHFRIGTGANDDLKFAFSVVGIVCADNLIPEANGNRDLGLSGTKWKDAYLSGTVNANTFSGNLSGGTVSGTTGVFSSKVGIGSITPQKKLDVAGIVKIYGNSSSHGIRIDPNSTGGTYETLLGTPNGDLRLQAGNASYFASQANILLESTSKDIIINAGNSGNVAIGTDDPRAKFDVRPGGHSGNGAITFTNGVGEVGSSNNAIQSINGDGSALQPLGYRATEHIFATQNAEKVRITSGTNPNAYLHVKGDGGGASGNDLFFKIESTSSGSYGPDLTMQHSSSSPADNDIISEINFNGLDDAGHRTTFASIDVKATDVSDASPKGDIIFKTRKDNVGVIEKLRITSDGHLLPGTDSQYNIGSNAVRFANIYADTFTGALTGNAATASSVTVRTDSGDANHNIVFVDSTTDNQNQVLKMDDENNRLQWNPSSELLLAYRLQSTDYIRSSKIRTDSGSYGTAGQVLTSQGVGNDWTWETPSSGNITPACVTAQRSSSANTTYNIITILTITINPTVSGSKLLITAGGPVRGGVDNANNEDTEVNMYLYRGSTQIGQTTESFSTSGGFYMAYLDSYDHGGNNVTYTLRMGPGAGDATEVCHANKGTSMSVQEII